MAGENEFLLKNIGIHGTISILNGNVTANVAKRVGRFIQGKTKVIRGNITGNGKRGNLYGEGKEIQVEKNQEREASQSQERETSHSPKGKAAGKKQSTRD